MFGEKSRDAWLLERWGDFTASEIYKLLVPGKGGQMFSSGGWTYIRQKAVESLTNIWERPELDFVPSLFHGKAYEQPAFEHYKTITRNYDMRYFGSENPLYLKYNKDSGGSPDGIMGHDENIVWGLELKCPKNPSVHFDYLQFKDQFELKEYDPGYYAQTQFNLMICKLNGCQGWHWASFDERFKNPNHQMKIIEVKHDIKYQNDLEIRLLQAIKEKNKIIASMS